jgi:hypothetical protein
MMEQIMMCTSCMSNYYFCDFFIKIIDNKKLEKSDEVYDDMYILYVRDML